MVKKNGLWGVLCVGLLCIGFTGCLTLLAGTSAGGDSRPSYYWQEGEYTNEWGDNLGKYFIQFNGECQGTFQNTWGSGDTTIRDVRFSHEEGLMFTTSNEVSIVDEKVTVAVHHGVDKDYIFSGQYVNRGNYGRIQIKYSDELLEALSGNNLSVRFNTRIYRCQFNYPPRFNEGYEKLKVKMGVMEA